MKRNSCYVVRFRPCQSVNNETIISLITIMKYMLQLCRICSIVIMDFIWSSLWRMVITWKSASPRPSMASAQNRKDLRASYLTPSISCPLPRRAKRGGKPTQALQPLCALLNPWDTKATPRCRRPSAQNSPAI